MSCPKKLFEWCLTLVELQTFWKHNTWQGYGNSLQLQTWINTLLLFQSLFSNYMMLHTLHLFFWKIKFSVSLWQRKIAIKTRNLKDYTNKWTSWLEHFWYALWLLGLMTSNMYCFCHYCCCWCSCFCSFSTSCG